MYKFLITLLMMLISAGVLALPPASPKRLDDVATRGRQVMPFDLKKTLHIFNKTDNGGIQQVIAKDAGDSQQIALIRQHLSAIASRFAQGDFSGPQRIHGRDMPGLAALSAAAGQVQFTYQDLPNGGQIDYQSQVPALITAVHEYFDAQLSDHARHALSGEQAKHFNH